MGLTAASITPAVGQVGGIAGADPATAITAVGIVVLLVLLGLSGFFSSSEIAMFSLADHRVDALVEEGTAGAATVAELKANPHRLLITILVGNNIVNIAMSSIATGLLAFYVPQGQAVAIATFGITTLVLLFGESAPKSYAVENTESWSLSIARPLKLSMYVLYPLVVLFDYLTRIVNQLTGGRSSIESSYVTREEIREMIRTGEREGILNEEEYRMLQRTLRFTNTIAKEIMTPRLDIVGVEVDTTINEAISTCVASGHTRLPVYDGSFDNVVGTADLHTLAGMRQEGTDGKTPLADLDLPDPPSHVPESKNVDELLREMRADRSEMVLVIDEYGTTEGLVTLKDIMELVAGEIPEATADSTQIERVDERTALVRSDVDIAEVNETLDLDLPDGEEFETVAGFMLNRAGRLVEEGETFEYDGVELVAETVEDTRIKRVRIRREGESGTGTEPE